MHGIKSLVVIALAATASASYFNGELLRREILHVRSTGLSNSTTAPAASIATGVSNSSSASAACSSVLKNLQSLVTGLPTPTGALSAYLVTAAATLTDPCKLTVPASVSSDFVVYESSVLSFYSDHSAQLNAALTSCPSLTSLIHNPVCSTGSAGVVTAQATPTPTATPTGPSTSASAVSSAGANGSPRETGIVAGIMVAAGFFGAVAVAL